MWRRFFDLKPESQGERVVAHCVVACLGLGSARWNWELEDQPPVPLGRQSPNVPVGTLGSGATNERERESRIRKGEGGS